MPETDPLYVVTVKATHKAGVLPNRWGTCTVRAKDWHQAAVSWQSIDVEHRLVDSHEVENWIIELRVYLADRDGQADGLPVGRSDVGVCRN